MCNNKQIRCPKCKKTYVFLGTFQEVSFCPECLLDEEELFQKIKDYINKNHGTTVGDLFLEFNISSEKIKHYLKMERLEILDHNNCNFLKCERCGIVINTGQYCNQCESATIKIQPKTNTTSDNNKSAIKFKDS